MKRTLRQRFYAGAACCLAPLWAWAAEADTITVYRSVDANGVVSFSDSPNPSAVPIEVLRPPTPLRADIERANELFDQQLALLELLETSRHARAKERIEEQRLELDFVRTEAALQRARDEQAQDDDRNFFPLFVTPFWGTQRPPFGRPPHGPKDRPPPSPPPQRVAFPH
jgi:Domain of unknown function (DUF4124)